MKWLLKQVANGEEPSLFCSLCIAIPTAAVIGGIGSVASGVIGANAAKSAAKTQANAATLASNNQLEMFHETQHNLQPYMDLGTGALPTLEDLLGTGPGGQAGIQSALEGTPGYQFTRDQGLKSVQNSYASRGLGSSGAALKGAADYTTGLANTTYEQRLQDYFNAAGRGQNAAAGLGALGQAATATAGNFATSGAAATAAGTVGAANALTSGIGAVTGGVSNAAQLLAFYNSGMFGQQTQAGNPASSTAGTALSPGVEPPPFE